MTKIKNQSGIELYYKYTKIVIYQIWQIEVKVEKRKRLNEDYEKCY